MFFKNLKVYQITGDFTMPDNDQAFQDHALRPCGSQDLATMGWVSPIPGGETLTHQANGFVSLCLGKEERILPASVVNDELQSRIESIEAETGAPVGKRARQDLKSEIVHQLIPKAFTRRSFIRGVYMPEIGVVAVDSATDGKAESFLAHLRKTLGSLPIVPLARRSLCNDLTLWVGTSSQVPDGFEVLEEAVLQSLDEDASTAKWKNQPMEAGEVCQALMSGKCVKSLAVEWDETLSCIINEDLTIKRIKFSDVIREQNDDIPKDRQAARWDADAALAYGELQRFIRRLSDIFNLQEDSESEEAHSENTFEDPFYPDAVQFVKESRRASISALQRHLRFGYNRCAHLMERMEREGIVSPPAYNGSREILAA